jgi:hypothetical protein
MSLALKLEDFIPYHLKDKSLLQTISCLNIVFLIFMKYFENSFQEIFPILRECKFPGVLLIHLLIKFQFFRF